MLSDDPFQILVSCACVVGFIRCWRSFGQVFDCSCDEAKMSIEAAIACAFSAFGVGYAAGAIQRIIRRSIEVLD